MAATNTTEFVRKRLASALPSAGSAEERKLLAGLRAAGIYGELESQADLKVANQFLDRAISAMMAKLSTSSCPRCKGSMLAVKLATKASGNFCKACRVVTPA